MPLLCHLMLEIVTCVASSVTAMVACITDIMFLLISVKISGSNMKKLMLIKKKQKSADSSFSCLDTDLDVAERAVVSISISTAAPFLPPYVLCPLLTLMVLIPKDQRRQMGKWET